MKNLLIKLVILNVFFLTSNANATSSCHIVLGSQQPCQHAMPLNVAFQDSLDLANKSPRRCAQRAFEYFQWCGFTPGSNWTGAYYDNGNGPMNATTTEGVKAYFHIVNPAGHYVEIGQGKVNR